MDSNSSREMQRVNTIGHITLISDPLKFFFLSDGWTNQTHISESHLPHFKTSLMLACEGGHVECARALINAGANVNAKNVRIGRERERERKREKRKGVREESVFLIP